MIGSRYHSSKPDDTYRTPPLRRLGMLFSTGILQLATGLHVSDTTSGFRALNRNAFAFFAANYPIDHPEAKIAPHPSPSGVSYRRDTCHDEAANKRAISLLGVSCYHLSPPGFDWFPRHRVQGRTTEMTVTFATEIQIVCMSTLAILLFYTLWLSRYRGLDTHVTVRWVLVQCAAMLAIVLWKWLPIFEFTSRLQDRQLLLVVTVLIFAFTAFLMLDLLVRISRQSIQIKKLVQELAIQSLRLDSVAPFENLPKRAETTPVRDETHIAPDAPPHPGTASWSSLSQILFMCWLLCIFALNENMNEPFSRWLVYSISSSNRSK